MSAGQDSVSIVRWSYAHAALMLFALVLQWTTAQPVWLVLVASLSLGFYIIRERAAYTSMWFGFGRANWLSLFRFAVLSLVVLFYSQIATGLVPIILIACVILDGFDGKLARQFDEQSDFGHYLDVEIDAFGVTALSVLLWHFENLTVIILLAGALRYGYVWLVRLTVRKQKLEPKRRYASIIAVTVYVIMTIRLVFDYAFFSWVLWFGLILLVASFARSFWFQWSDQEVHMINHQ